MDNLEVDFSTQEVSDLAAIMDDVLTRKKLTIDAQLDLLLTAKTVDPVKAAVVRGIANLQVYINLRRREEKKACRTILTPFSLPIPST
ncbi:hypothetical protein G6F65_023123 [Rhizopus arrhizus]|nr:hypothetical protein G6F65_023123 [Rhizopus arrhizus]